MQNTVDRAPEMLTYIEKKLRNQLHLIWSQINYCEDLETSSFALTDYLNKAKQIYQSYKSHDNYVTLIAEKTKQEIERQIQLFFSSLEKLSAVHQSSQATKLRVSEINDENQSIVEHLERAFKLLRDVSGMTKILSINANIEAARLGQQGAAFKVVASEVQKLSEVTGKSTQDVSGTTQKIMLQSAEMAEFLHSNQLFLDESMTELTHVREGFTGMKSKMQEIVNESIHFDDIFHEIIQSLDKAYMMVEYNRVSYANIKTVLEQQAQELEEILAEIHKANPAPLNSLVNSSATRDWYKEYYNRFKNEDTQSCLRILEDALASGETPSFLLTHVVERTVEKIGKEQIDYEVPLSEIYLNGKIIEQSLNLLLPLISQGDKLQHAPKVVIGNAFGDYHALGRKIVATFLRMGGFDVIDLGLSVSNQLFVDTVKKEKAKVICVSALIIHTAKEIIELRELLNKNGLSHVKILVGGAPFNFEPRLVQEVKADVMAKNGVEAIKVVKELLGLLDKGGAK